jgi:predicted transcriptional regulator
MKNKYETHVLPRLEEICQWLEKGATIKDVANALGISYSTIRKYLDEGQKGVKRYAAFYNSFAESQEVADRNVENALYRRACGYDYEEKTYERKKDPETGEITILHTKTVKKHIPPDPTSAMFWLTNRMPDKYKYRQIATKNEDEEQSDGGVVEIPSVMPNPGPPKEVIENGT